MICMCYSAYVAFQELRDSDPKEAILAGVTSLMAVSLTTLSYSTNHIEPLPSSYHVMPCFMASDHATHVG